MQYRVQSNTDITVCKDNVAQSLMETALLLRRKKHLDVYWSGMRESCEIKKGSSQIDMNCVTSELMYILQILLVVSCSPACVHIFMISTDALDFHDTRAL